MSPEALEPVQRFSPSISIKFTSKKIPTLKQLILETNITKLVKYTVFELGQVRLKDLCFSFDPFPEEILDHELYSDFEVSKTSHTMKRKKLTKIIELKDIVSGN